MCISFITQDCIDASNLRRRLVLKSFFCECRSFTASFVRSKAGESSSAGVLNAMTLQKLKENLAPTQTVASHNLNLLRIVERFQIIRMIGDDSSDQEGAIHLCEADAGGVPVFKNKNDNKQQLLNNHHPLFFFLLFFKSNQRGQTTVALDCGYEAS